MNKLNLTKYGRFKNASFDLAPVTVFFGGNESGKTTIFDAIFEQLCSAAPKRGNVWSRLSARYGELSERQAESDISVPYDSGEEFLSLFAVRSSDISLAAGRDAWTSAAGRKIFLQGLDLVKMSGNLRKISNPHRASNEAKDFESLEAALKQAESLLESKIALEAEAAGRKNIINSLESQLAALEQQAAEKKALLESRTGIIEKLKEKRQLVRAYANRDFVSSYVSKKKFCDENPLVSAELISEYDSLVIKRDETKARLDAAKSTIKEKEIFLADLEQKLPEQGKKRSEAEMLEGAADNFKEKVQAIFEFRENNDKFKETPIVFSLISPVIALAGVIAAFALHSYTIAAWLLIPAGIVMALLFYKGFVRRRNRSAEKAQEDKMLGEILSSWGERFDVNILKGLPPEQILVKFAQLAETAKRERDLHKSMLADKEKAQMAITDAMAASSGIQLDFDTEKLSTEEWLRGKGYSDRDSYMRAAENKRMAAEFVKSNSQSIEKLMSQESCMSAEALLCVLDSRVKSYENKGNAPVNAEELEREIIVQENAAKDLRLEIMNLEEQMKNTAVEKTRNDTDFEHTCLNLPQEIASLRKNILSLQEKISAENTKRSAAALAADVLSSMGDEASAKFKELARKAGIFLEKIMPSSEISISSLSMEGLQMKDSQGEFRTPGLLSSGTRDCLMLAMRLCLAEESFGSRDKVMLFDDPFLNLDDARMEKAVEVLRNFRNSSGCQLIFFTKDSRLLQLLSTDWRVKVNKL